VLGVAEVAAATALAVRRALEPALLPERLRPLHVLAACARPLGRRGHILRGRLVAQGTQRYEMLLPAIVERMLGCLPLTELVLRHMDLDELVATVDLDAAVGRLDVQAVVAMLDLDEVTRHLDIEAVLDRMDLTATVLDRVDMQKVADGVLSQVDLAAIVSQVLDEVDLPEVIRESTGDDGLRHRAQRAHARRQRRPARDTVRRLAPAAALPPAWRGRRAR
jgi:hypothetical protein